MFNVECSMFNTVFEVCLLKESIPCLLSVMKKLHHASSRQLLVPHDGTTRRYRIFVAYDGTGYSGWQVQPNGMTIQEKIEDAIFTLAGQRVKVNGSGRTDQGVHARKQVAHFDLPGRLPPKAFHRGLNALLPPDIRIMKVEQTSADFHARRDVKRKEYRYFIWNAEVMPPDLRHHRLHVRRKLDVKAMRQAARHLVGKHDFSAFAANPSREIESTVRNLTDLRVTKRGHEIVIIAISEGFLYKMVRSLAGFLIRVGEGAVPPQESHGILSSRVRTARVPTAPAHGLFLWNATY